MSGAFIEENGMAANPVPGPSRAFDIDCRVAEDGTPTLVCRGRLSTETSGLFRSEVKRLIPEHKRILADLGQVDYVDSSGLGAILAAYVSADTAGCELKLINLSPRLKDLLHITRLATIFEAYGEQR